MCINKIIQSFLSICLLLISSLSSLHASNLEKVTFGIGWKAEPEYGGFYQAAATGIYEAYGLDVTVKAYGAGSNTIQLLIAGDIDYRMGGNGYMSLNYVKEGIPFVSVAACFQKDPSVLIARKNNQLETIKDLNDRPILIGAMSKVSWWKFLVNRYGFKDENVRPYNFNMAPFIADDQLVQQGYLTSEPYALKKAGVEPQVFLLADYGFKAYGTLIDTSVKRVQNNPDQVQRFVEASILGWYSYLYGDPSPANAIIKKQNPEMTDEKIAYSIQSMKSFGILNSGDAEKNGIGTMSDDRWKSFFNDSVEIGLYKSDMDYKKAYSLQFVNQPEKIKTKAAALKLNLP